MKNLITKLQQRLEQYENGFLGPGEFRLAALDDLIQFTNNASAEEGDLLMTKLVEMLITGSNHA